MDTREAYEQAVKELCTAAKRKDFEMASWLACTIEILWERVKQEAIAASMDAFSPQQVITLVNSHLRTQETIQRMKDDPVTYGSLYKSRVSI